MNENINSPSDVPPDNSMKEPNLESSYEYVVPSRSISTIENALSQLVTLNEQNIIHEPTCIVCSSPYRSDIEDLYIQKKTKEEIIAFLKSRTNVSFSSDVIDNHMRYHHDKGIKELQKIEYIDRLRRLSSQDTTTLNRIRIALDALTERLVNINAITPAGDLTPADIEKIKSQETSRITKTMNQLLQLQANLMGEMKNSGELITIPKKAFVEFFNDSLLNSSSELERKIIQNLLSKLGELSKL